MLVHFVKYSNNMTIVRQSEDIARRIIGHQRITRVTYLHMGKASAMAAPTITSRMIWAYVAARSGVVLSDYFSI